jgi:hypothetical protein
MGKGHISSIDNYCVTNLDVSVCNQFVVHGGLVSDLYMHMSVRSAIHKPICTTKPPNDMAGYEEKKAWRHITSLCSYLLNI